MDTYYSVMLDELSDNPIRRNDRAKKHKAEREARQAQAAAEKPAKGVCRKCGKHIGRGLYLHEKACQG